MFGCYQNHIDIDYKDVSTHSSTLEILFSDAATKEIIQRSTSGFGTLEEPNGISENNDSGCRFPPSLSEGLPHRLPWLTILSSPLHIGTAAPCSPCCGFHAHPCSPQSSLLLYSQHGRVAPGSDLPDFD